MPVAATPSPVLSSAKPAPAEPASAQPSGHTPSPAEQLQQQPVSRLALNAHAASGPPRKRLKSSPTASIASTLPQDHRRPFSQAHIGGKPFVPDQFPEGMGDHAGDHGSNNRHEALERLKHFLGSTLSNNRYESIEQLQLRAENVLHHFEAEQKILEQTKAGLEDPHSAVYQQATWMAHLERLNWKEAAPLGPDDREHWARAIEPGQGYARDSPLRGLRMAEPIAQTLSMMMKGQEGPLTESQSLAGFELAQLGTVIASRLRIEERKNYRQQARVDADRQGTSMLTTRDGMDLSKDLGTQLRDEYCLPVMTGTSGSSSDAALSTKFASMKAGVPWAAPGLDEEQAQRAASDLGLQYFRDDRSAPAHVTAAVVNHLRAAAHLPPMHVVAQRVFTHSYPEIDAAVRLTLQGQSGWDEQAMRAATLASAQRLSDVATELALEAEQAAAREQPPAKSDAKPSPV
jgi:hypothetical protein